MANEKVNCWEYMKCQRQPDGNKSDEMGVCPASMDDTFDGINFGKTQEESAGPLQAPAAEEKFREHMPKRGILAPVVNSIKWSRMKKGLSCRARSF